MTAAGSPPSTRVGIAILVLVGIVVLGSIPFAAVAVTTDGGEGPPDRKLVTVRPDSTNSLWPYTSRGQSFERATLPINFVVLERAERVRYLLAHSTGARWNVTEHNESLDGRTRSGPESGIVRNGTAIQWAEAAGSSRFTYVYNHEAGNGQWLEERYQLHDGDYFGTRYHIRLYEPPDTEARWTAMQIHREHWDWFRLRHTVDSVGQAQFYLEHEFYGAWFTRNVYRVRFANAGALDSDGWVTFVEIDLEDRESVGLVSIMLLATAPWFRRSKSVGRAVRDRYGQLQQAEAPRYVALAASLSVLPLLVRLGAISLERTFPTASPLLIGGGFYLALVLGIPALAIVLSRGLQPTLSGVAASFGFGAGILAEYVYLGISALWVGIIVHRGLLVAALCVVAAGSAYRRASGTADARLLAAGLLGWLALLVAPPLGVL